jgi:hypothetical protein
MLQAPHDEDKGQSREGMLCTVCHQSLDDEYVILPECKQPHPYCQACASKLVRPFRKFRGAVSLFTALGGGPPPTMEGVAPPPQGTFGMPGPFNLVISGGPSFPSFMQGPFGIAVRSNEKNNENLSAEKFSVTCELCKVVYSFSTF